MNQQALKPSEIARVNVDTTVQEKAIAFPPMLGWLTKPERWCVLLASIRST